MTSFIVTRLLGIGAAAALFVAFAATPISATSLVSSGDQEIANGSHPGQSGPNGPGGGHPGSSGPGSSGPGGGDGNAK